MRGWLLVQVMVLVAAMVGGAWAYDRVVTAPLRAELRSALVSREVLETLRREMAAGRGTPAAPAEVRVSLQGRPQDVRVFVETPRLPEGAPPGPAPVSRVVVEAPPVFCRTKEECDALYARAPQALRVSAQVQAGTLAFVCLEALRDGRCPDGKEASLPLSRPLAFSLDVVASERGVFHGLNVEGAPAVVTQVRTETQVDLRAPGPPRLPANLWAFGRADAFSGAAVAGLRYTNWWGRGVYEVEVGARYLPGASPAVGPSLWLGYALPLR
jgi:hypothetical protein